MKNLVICSYNLNNQGKNNLNKEQAHIINDLLKNHSVDILGLQRGAFTLLEELELPEGYKVYTGDKKYHLSRKNETNFIITNLPDSNFKLSDSIYLPYQPKLTEVITDTINNKQFRGLYDKNPHTLMQGIYTKQGNCINDSSEFLNVMNYSGATYYPSLQDQQLQTVSSSIPSISTYQSMDTIITTNISVTQDNYILKTWETVMNWSNSKILIPKLYNDDLPASIIVIPKTWEILEELKSLEEYKSDSKTTPILVKIRKEKKQN